ncbi:MAG: hypothetical protein OS130_07730 [Thermodesulfobacteriota bacterium]|jgi:hypothetical protein|nr:MAG: hypothetical protein OS130_07730 [Thermodesulfobacteriota bacterium]
MIPLTWRKTQSTGQWFYNFELVAAQDIRQETVQYVSNIYKYYLTYRRILELREMKEKAISKN